MKTLPFLFILAAFNLITGNFAYSADESSPPNGVVTFHSVKEVVELVPRQSIMQLKIPTQAEAAKTAANTALSQGVIGKWGTWKVKVLRWAPYDSPGAVPSKFQIHIVDQNMNVNGTVVGVRLMVYAGADADPVMKKLNNGAEITVTGYIDRADFTSNKSEGIRLNLDVTRSKIELGTH